MPAKNRLDRAPDPADLSIINQTLRVKLRKRCRRTAPRAHAIRANDQA
ncbi:MAG: hypothetical protein AAF086_03485 [Planctomycetota bacterium]